MSIVEKAEAAAAAVGLLSSVFKPLKTGTMHFITRLICVMVGSLAAASALSRKETFSRVLKRTKTASLTAGNGGNTDNFAGSPTKPTESALLPTEERFKAAALAGNIPNSVKRGERVSCAATLLGLEDTSCNPADKSKSVVGGCLVLETVSSAAQATRIKAAPLSNRLRVLDERRCVVNNKWLVSDLSKESELLGIKKPILESEAEEELLFLLMRMQLAILTCVLAVAAASLHVDVSDVKVVADSSL